MIERRRVLTGIGGVAATLVIAQARSEPMMTADGLYTEPWFLKSFLDLRSDIEDTTKKGKRFVIMWSLKGCPYCKETHIVNFGNPKIVEYIRARFEVLQLNIIGSLPVTDFDGQSIREKELAYKNKIHFTPTFQFFSEAKTAQDKVSEVARLPGYVDPDNFLSMFRFVEASAYKDMSFGQFVKSGRS